MRETESRKQRVAERRTRVHESEMKKGHTAKRKCRKDRLVRHTKLEGETTREKQRKNTLPTHDHRMRLRGTNGRLMWRFYCHFRCADHGWFGESTDFTMNFNNWLVLRRSVRCNCVYLRIRVTCGAFRRVIHIMCETLTALKRALFVYFRRRVCVLRRTRTSNMWYNTRSPNVYKQLAKWFFASLACFCSV